ncbi:hypothetical protein F52700_8902 [Fusarium sp. NRRL 52700]|nr:hypothetical protein F52700_8902 [Fusarium sp. NRRL 52700]
MDDLLTRRRFLLDELAEIDDTIAVYRELAGEDEDDADTLRASLPSGGDDSNSDNDNNDTEDDNQISLDFSGGRMEIFPEGPGTPGATSDDDDVDFIMSSPQEPSKLSLRERTSIALWQGPRHDPRFKSDQWLSEKPNESFSRDFLQEIGTQRLCNTLRPEIWVLMLAHPEAARCPTHKACHHWELRWDDRPRRDPGTLELELICLDPRDRGIYTNPPGNRFQLLDKDHPRPIECDPCFMFNALKPDFRSLERANLDVVLFRVLEPRDGNDSRPVEGRDESPGNNLDYPFEKIGWTEVYHYMDRCGRQLASLSNICSSIL